MNEAPSSQTGLSDTFSSQQAPQTNPFTADLKGEFTSNFGTNTNAVSQIFKEGGFVNQNRAKYLAIGGVVIVLLAVLFFVLTTGEDEGAEGDDVAGETSETGEDTPEDGAAEGETTDKEESSEVAKAEDTKKEPEVPAEAAAPAPEATAPKASAPVAESMPAKSSGGMGGSGPITLQEPADGSTLNYDETQGPAQFSWTGGSGHIVFSRSPSMNPPSMRVYVKGNSYSFDHPWPGTWYWKVENRSGSTETRSFKVEAPQRRVVQLSQPTSGGAVAGNGGTVTWQGDGKIAYYRVEFSTGGWGNPQHRFASSGNSVQLNGVAPGQYQMRVGAFSEVSGRWEYTAPVPVTVQ